jgi:pyruvate dehydrogenase E2 component (dihydrolipoamide acetyltransferase)
VATIKEVLLPDIGDFKEVEVIEVMVAPGDTLQVDDSLVALESDKATMEVPSVYAGTVRVVHVAVGDKVSEGTPLLTMEAEDAAAEVPPVPQPEPEAAPQAAAQEEAPPSPPGPPIASPAPKVEAAPQAAEPEAGGEEPTRFEEEPTRRPPEVEPLPTIDEAAFAKAHASPSVRRFARELGVSLSQVQGSGRKGRILSSDVQAFVKQRLRKPPAAAPAAAGMALPELPEVDFTAFGEVETRPLSRIQRLSGANLQRNWNLIPHVTQLDKADISELEAFRKSLLSEADKRGVKLTLLAFLIKAVVYALKEFPVFNASLDRNGENLVLKRYYHIGFAVDTPNGLVVPVLRDADRKGLFDIAAELRDLSVKARDKKLTPSDMQGGCFTISSLGGIGGTAFTPIINWPEVAILGVSRSAMEPVYQDGEFVPRLMLPLSLSYDHRVVDGAAGARFTRFLSGLLTDIRRVLL